MYPRTLGRFIDPQVVTSHFHLREGDVVADFGAGSGYYMRPLAHAVGRSGTVYLCEIQKNLVDALGNKARDERLANVRPLWCDLEKPKGTKLADGILDAGLVSNVLFQMPHKETALQEIARVIRKGGKLFLIDWTDSFGGLGPQPKDVLIESQARTLAEQAGFSIEGTFPAGDHHYGLMCRKK
jgi:ubiquinone/menaquinone biosynthesis C-methylase UbiE